MPGSAPLPGEPLTSALYTEGAKTGMTGRGVLSHGANSHEGSSGHTKRTVKRAIRGFFIWGRSTYRGKRLLEWRDLVRNFQIQVIAQVRGEIAGQRQYWALQMRGKTTDDEAITQRLE